MKKQNMITFLSLFIVICLVLLYMVISDSFDKKEKVEEESITETVSVIQDIPTYTTAPTTQYTYNPDAVTDISMNNSLFIGDSRTVGVKEYAGIDEADFFCTVGLGLHNYKKTSVSFPEHGDLTLANLLNAKKYNKIYICLGVNDLGYDFNGTIKLFDEFLNLIKTNQPDAKIFIIANLHVAHSRSQKDDVINNKEINIINNEFSKFADNKTVFYLDGNCLYDDANGALASDKTGDNTHLYAKYYAEWGHWIMVQSENLIR